MKGGFKLESVKEEEELKDGPFTVPSFIEDNNYEMKFEEEPGVFEEDEFKNDDNEFNNIDEESNPGYAMEIENSFSTPRHQNMLGTK